VIVDLLQLEIILLAHLTWREIVEKDCQARKLNKEDAINRKRWRNQIRDNDDHDRCEWLNVSSGTSCPGLSQTKSREP